jgi:phage tail sheath gpL-like
MTISFNEIPSNIRTPFMFTEFDNSNAVSGAQNQPFKAVVIGQLLSTGTKANLDLSRVTSAKQAELFYGKGSMLHEMFEAWFANNAFTEVYGLALSDLAEGVEAAGSIKFAGAPTKAGIALFRICGYKVNVAVTTSDTPATLATKLVTAITASAPSVTAVVNGVDTSKVDITYKHKGLVGNYLDIRQGYYDDEKGLPAGLTSTIVQFTGGVGNPDITTALATLPPEHYNVFAFPYTDSSNLLALDAMLLERWGAMKMIDGMAFSAANLSHSSLGTLGDDLNTKNLCIIDSHASMSGPHKWASAISGCVAFEMANDPARPLQTVEIKGVYAEESKDSFTQQERNLLLFDGISTHVRGANGEARIERLITTYRVNALGADDISYLNVESIYQLSYIRYDWNGYMKRKYPRHKLADDGVRVAPGQPIMTPSLYKSEMVAKYEDWVEKGIVENIEAFKKGLIAERNMADPDRMDAIMEPDLMNQFRVGATKILFLL